MGRKSTTLFIVGAFIAALATFAGAAEEPIQLDNACLSRQIGVVDGHLATLGFTNKRSGKALTPLRGEEFRLRISKGVDSIKPDALLTSADFAVNGITGTATEVVADLQNADRGLQVKVRYTLEPGKFYGHKQLTISSRQPCTLELIDIESIPCSDAFSPYRAKDMMWTDKKFLPALGQPLYTANSAAFWGVEFPACWNRVEDGTIRCGYQPGVELQPGVPYSTHLAVFGVGDDPGFIKDAFLEYIDQVRVTPVQLKIQFNTWFDLKAAVTQARFLESLQTLNQELVIKRGCKPLDVYTIDDGWQNSRPPRSPLADWTTGLFQVNEKSFDKDLQGVRKAIEAKGSKMGIWLSPACIFGARANIDVLEKAGFEVLVGDKSAKSGMVRKAMSMTGPKYTALLERRLLELQDMGAVYFKLDGIFGDVVCRYFETRPGRGAPVVAHLIPSGMPANDPAFDDPKFDETKRYYITAATERLADIFDRMHAKNPLVRILCHNGATISPWWLMHLDVLSLVNSNDGAPGDRNEQLCYRDGLYYQLTQRDRNQIPICSFFNHEPTKDASRFSDKTVEDFRDYLFMELSRGTTNVEMYFVVNTMQPKDFDVAADALKWLYHISPAFKRSRMHGGNPAGPTSADEGNLSMKKVNLDEAGEVYGYDGWTESLGYVSIHNPTSKTQPYSFRLDRKFGLLPGSGPFAMSFTNGRMPDDMKKVWNFGETVTITMPPHGIVVVNFDRVSK